MGCGVDLRAASDLRLPGGLPRRFLVAVLPERAGALNVSVHVALQKWIA
jgi:hypothetical protein